MRNLILTALLGLAAVNLSGCVPVVAVGIGAGAMMADDRRTASTYLMDEEIELKVASRIREAYTEGVHVNVISYNRRVLLTGEAADAAARAKAEQIAKDVTNVREVQNEILLAGVSTIMARSNDAYITTKVKARFLDDRRFSVNHVKVVTEAGTVFLMGVVKREEGAAAAEVAAKTSGVAKVVKVFEYID
ncbi:MAG: BON domain-containing protein [Pseudomonadota bacterium]|nr:BON domain-containing protein [Pseudomonadota bacterium]MDP1572938.1 BON domain-containing protein [Pseudomonadota bacterium]MDP1906174.1 BON domain-containing protein [Pseudomonadota bacterium]